MSEQPNSIFSGVLAFPVTPFDQTGAEFAVAPYRKLLERLIAGTVDAVIPLGSTGEFAYLSLDERRKVATESIQIVDKRVPVIVGVSAITTRDTIELTQHAEKVGADGIMISIPTYYALSAEEVQRHITAVASSTSLPVMLYNNPFTSAVDLTADLVAGLDHVKNIVAIKEATMDIKRISILQAKLGDRFEILGGGFDPYAFSAMCLGVSGWTTGMANLIPEKCAELFDTVARQRDLMKGLVLHQELFPLASLLVELGLTKAVKAGLHMLGFDVGPARAPLGGLTPEGSARLEKALRTVVK